MATASLPEIITYILLFETSPSLKIIYPLENTSSYIFVQSLKDILFEEKT